MFIVNGGRLDRLKYWNHDYDDIITVLKVFMVIFSAIPIGHEFMFFVVWYSRLKVLAKRKKTYHNLFVEEAQTREPLLRQQIDDSSYHSINEEYSMKPNESPRREQQYLELQDSEESKYSPPNIRGRYGNSQ